MKSLFFSFNFSLNGNINDNEMAGICSKKNINTEVTGNLHLQ